MEQCAPSRIPGNTQRSDRDSIWRTKLYLERGVVRNLHLGAFEGALRNGRKDDVVQQAGGGHGEEGAVKNGHRIRRLVVGREVGGTDLDEVIHASG